MNLPLTKSCGPLPLNYRDTPKNFFRSIINRLRVQISSASVLLGRVNGSEPTANVGPWMNSRSWYYWNRTKGKYTGIPISVGNSGFLLKSVPQTLTADRAVSFQDKGISVGAPNERVALLEDVYIPRDPFLIPKDPTAGLLVIDMSLYENFYGQLHENITLIEILPFVPPDGKTVYVTLLNDGTKFTVDWSTGGIKWAAGTPPVQPVSTATGSGVGQYILRVIHGGIYGEFTDATPASPTMLAISPAIPKNYGSSGNLPRANVTKNLP